MKFFKKVSIFLPVIFILIIFIKPILGKGLIVGGDWTFPYSNSQLTEMSVDGLNLWSFRQIPTGTQIPHQNLYLFQLLGRFFGTLGMDGILFQKSFISVVILGIYYSAYLLLIKITNKRFPSHIGATAYLFSPVVFNYFNMGWIFVLLFMALSPFFLLLLLKYFETGNKGALLGLGIITSVAFLQSQAIFWLPVILIAVSLSFLKQGKIVEIVNKTTTAFVSMIVITFIVHMVWIIPTSNNAEPYLLSSVSASDLSRFGAVDNLKNQFRGWGSLFNSHFELSFDQRFQFSSYLSILIVTFLLILNNRFKNKFILLSVILSLVAPVIFIFKNQLLQLPLSNIVRDTGRFIVITQLGFALGIGIFLTKFDNKIVKLIVISLLLLSISPFILGRLTKPENILYGASGFGRDQRLRLLSVPIDENEKIMISYGGKRNIFMPTGSFVKSITDKRFDQAFAEIGDFDSLFSPYSVGLYISDKSDQSITNFADTLLDSARNDKQLFNSLAMIYGIENIFVRNGLMTSYKGELGPSWEIQNCKETNEFSSDWSISKVCQINNSYPMLFTSTKMISSEAFSFDYSLKTNLTDSSQKITVVGCPNEWGPTKSSICKIDPGYNFFGDPPDVTIKNITRTSFFVSVDKTKNPKSDYLLVLNQSLHAGWQIRDVSTGNNLNYQKVLVNQLVNGWIVPAKENEVIDNFLIGFYPQEKFNFLLPISILSLIFITFMSSFLLLKNYQHEK